MVHIGDLEDVVVCTDLLGNEPHRKIDEGSMVTSGSLGGVIVSTLAWNATGMCLIPPLGTIFPIFIIPPPP